MAHALAPAVGGGQLLGAAPAPNPLAAAAEQLAPGGRAGGAYGYWADPVAWAHDCITWPAGEEPTVYQDEIWSAVHEHKRVAVRGPHGLGKTCLASIGVLHYATTRDGYDWKALSTASAWRQLSYYLWPEIHKWARRIRWERLGRSAWRLGSELLQMEVKLRTGHAMAVASDDPAYLEGAHADHLMYVFDEAKAIQAATWDAAEGAFSGAGTDTPHEALALAISTPGPPSGRFYDIHQRKPGTHDWWVRHVTVDEAIAAGRVSRQWVEARRLQWGPDSAMFQNRVLGNFATSDTENTIPLTWVEEAQERWQTYALKHTQPEWPFSCIGVDVAPHQGQAHSVLALRYGPWVAPLEDLGVADTMHTAGSVAQLLLARGGYAHVDVIGPGAGVHARLVEQGITSHAFNAGARTDQLDMSGEIGFANRRSAAWWTMRELLDPTNGFNLLLPPDDDLTAELTAPTWRMASGGKLLVEPKDTVVQRLGRSTDKADAVIQSFALLEDEAEHTFIYDRPVRIGAQL